MDGSHGNFFIFPRKQYWRWRQAELDLKAAELTEQSLVAIARSRALLDRTHRRLSPPSVNGIAAGSTEARL